MKRQLKDNIKEFINKEPVRFHMPGHKGRIGEDYFKNDITELSFNDNLLKPNDVILSMQRNIEKIFKTKKSYVLVNGSSSGIISSLLCVLKENDKVLIPRNSHISAYYGVYLSNAKPVYVYPKDNNTGIKEKEYLEAIVEQKDIKAVFITYPSYFGYCLDIKHLCSEIKKIRQDIIIIVDEAHGTHLYFSDEYPLSSLEAKSDIVITSMHKTLTGLTQTSLLHVNSDLIDINKLELFYKMTTSTSPSYLLITSVEEGVYFANENAKNILSEIKRWYFGAKDEIENKTSFYFEEFESDYHDYTKICINTVNTNLDGYMLGNILEDEYKIFTECSTEKYVLVYLGLGNKREDIEKLVLALVDISENKCINIKKKKDIIFENNKPIIKYSMKETHFLDKENIDINESIGYASYDFIVPYPPGYPILTPGEIINGETIKYINKIKEKQNILGINENMINVVRE